MFSEHAGKLLFRDALRHKIWGADAYIDDLSINQYIYVLRKTYLSGGIDLNQYVTLARSAGWRITADAALPQEAAGRAN
jgi:DNA-binding response OmpR family regulator